MRAAVLLAERADRNPWWREAVHAGRDGAAWGWLVAIVAAVVVWVARGVPSPATAAAVAVLTPVGAGAGAWRAWRRSTARDVNERRAAARAALRGWVTVYAAAAAVVPAVAAGALLPVGLTAVALLELAVVTIPVRARARLLRRLRIGAAAVAGGDEVRVGRALWSGRRLDQVRISYPADWAAQKAGKRDDLVERVMWDLCGPPAVTPAAAIARPDYLTTWEHGCLLVERVPSLPRLLSARDWGKVGGVVLGQTVPDLADAVVDGVPVAVWRPESHALIVGPTQHGKSSGVRAWAVHGLTSGVFPGGLWGVDGKGSGSLAPLIGRRGVHAIAHAPDEWRHVLVELVAPEVARRYAEALAWRSGQSKTKPRHRRALLVLDEIQQVLMQCPDLRDVLSTLARQALESNVLIWVLTQRPDAADAVPGAMRDQLVDRVTFGPLSGSGAKMSFDVSGDWHRALGVSPVPGRALTWMGGAWRPVHAPWLPYPVDDPSVEPLYPPRAAEGRSGGKGGRRKDQGDSGGHNGGHNGGQDQPDAPIPQVDEILNDFDKNGPQSAAYDPANPYQRGRRRRRD